MSEDREYVVSNRSAGGSWLRTSTRWGIYLRDKLTCVYCLRGIQELMQDGECFVLDHIKPRSLGGTNDPKNLITSCWGCNDLKRVNSLAWMAKELGVKAGTLRGRVWRWSHRDLSIPRAQARIALGQVAGFEIQPVVLEHDLLVRGRWSSGLSAEWIQRLHDEHSLFCAKCGAPKKHEHFPF